MQKAFIETQFPIARLSAESYKERKAGSSQTLTGLGKWWGRKPLILVRACILGMLMPASNDPKKDREIFLKILTMDDDGAWQRQKGEIPVKAWREAAPAEIQDKYFGARGFQRGISDEEKEFILAEIWERLSDQQRARLDEQRKRPIPDRNTFDGLAYAERIEHCERPENVSGPSQTAWNDINEHLGLDATCLTELIGQLGQKYFGHTPRIGDSFCGGGSIPFEAARIGCESYGSDLNPIAGLLTWAGLNLIGGGKELQDEICKAQKNAVLEAEKEINLWGIENNDSNEKAEAFLYCVEAKPEGSEYYIPLAPNWVVAEKYNIVVDWERIEGSDRLRPLVRSAGSDEFSHYKNKKGATIVNGRVVDPFDQSRTWSVEALRGPGGLRRWTNSDISPRPEDTFQERLYCIRWINDKGERRYKAPGEEDILRESQVLALLSERFTEWQGKGFIPSKAIPERGAETDRLFRERGWTHWHHLFSPRQLLVHGIISEKLAGQDKESSQAKVASLLLMSMLANWDSKLCIWNKNLAKSGGIGAFEQTFANQALNTLFNFGSRGFSGLAGFRLSFPSSPTLKPGLAFVQDARDISDTCDIWITDPPYADAVNYHELSDFFLAWAEKRLQTTFPEWGSDSRTELAVRGDGEEFRRSMVEIYRNLALRMPDNGMQLVMFTHQNPAVWADLGMILWAAGLKATSAWTISTETAAGLKKGNYVQGTVCLVLRESLDKRVLIRSRDAETLLSP